MKKIIALILALALVLTSGATVFAQASSPVAIPEDVKGFSYEEAVTALIEKGIVVGETDGLFHPYDTLTRAQACIMIVKAMNAPAIQAAGTQSTAHNQFKDMAGYGWAEGYISYAVKEGVISGYLDGTFKPGNDVTMAELLTMVVRAAGFREGQVTGTWPANYINKAAELEILTGISEPLPEKATRWMAALVLYEALDLIEEANSDIEIIDSAQDEEDQEVEPATEQKANLPITRTIAGLDFTGPMLKLSLEEALENALTSGSAIKAAEIKKQADLANSRGQSELISDMREANRNPESWVSFSKSDLERARKGRDYFSSMAERDPDTIAN